MNHSYLNDQVRRQLRQDVRDVGDGERDGVLFVRHVKVTLQASDAGVA